MRIKADCGVETWHEGPCWVVASALPPEDAEADRQVFSEEADAVFALHAREDLPRALDTIDLFEKYAREALAQDASPSWGVTLSPYLRDGLRAALAKVDGEEG